EGGRGEQPVRREVPGGRAAGGGGGGDDRGARLRRWNRITPRHGLVVARPPKNRERLAPCERIARDSSQPREQLRAVLLSSPATFAIPFSAKLTPEVHAEARRASRHRLDPAASLRPARRGAPRPHL